MTGRFTGDRTYWSNLVHCLPEEEDIQYMLYSRTPIPPEDIPHSPNITTCVVPAANDRVWTLIALPLALRRDKIHLVHVQYTVPLPFLCPCPVVSTIHDISFRLYPEWYRRKDRILLNLTTKLAMRWAKKIITVSESSRKDILANYSVPPEKVAATPLGLSKEFLDFARSENIEADEKRQNVILQKYGLRLPFILSVGVLQPRKNNRTLVEAFALMKGKTGLPHCLVLAGKMGWYTDLEELKRIATESGGAAAADSLLLPGYIEDSDLPYLYRMCSIFAHPALYEGFGIPPLEAMSCGAPVIVSDSPALKEVVGDSAMIAPAKDVEAWAGGLTEMITNSSLRESFSELGRKRASLFSWKTTAQRTLDIYKEVLTG